MDISRFREGIRRMGEELDVMSGLIADMAAEPRPVAPVVPVVPVDYMPINGHKLDGVPFKQAADHGGVIVPEAIIIHYTAGASGASDIHTLSAKDDNYVSAHLVIDRDGSITQLVPFNIRAHHAGVSEWQGRKELNAWSIGIELTNWGPLVKKGGQWCCWPGGFTRAFPSGLGVFEGRHKNPACQYVGWEAFGEAQVAACERVVRALSKKYGINLVLGHDDVSPGRKVDPGPAFPMDRIRASVAGN